MYAVDGGMKGTAFSAPYATHKCRFGTAICKRIGKAAAQICKVNLARVKPLPRIGKKNQSFFPCLKSCE